MTNKQWNEIGKVYEKPWGNYRALEIGDNYQVKIITVNPGKRLSLQKHDKRSEHWAIIEGTPTVIVNDQVEVLSQGQSIDIPVEAVHRLENHTDIPIAIIEVQKGEYLGEDDIVRLEDDFGRE